MRCTVQAYERSVMRVFEGQFPIEATIGRDGARFSNLCPTEHLVIGPVNHGYGRRRFCRSNAIKTIWAAPGSKGSETLRNHLKCDQRFGLIEFHSLEVSWDSFDGFFESIQKRKPKGIISLGEGRSENIRLEKLGRNYADGKDERSVIKNEKK